MFSSMLASVSSVRMAALLLEDLQTSSDVCTAVTCFCHPPSKSVLSSLVIILGLASGKVAYLEFQLDSSSSWTLRQRLVLCGYTGFPVRALWVHRLQNPHGETAFLKVLVCSEFVRNRLAIKQFDVAAAGTEEGFTDHKLSFVLTPDRVEVAVGDLEKPRRLSGTNFVRESLAAGYSDSLGKSDVKFQAPPKFLFSTRDEIVFVFGDVLRVLDVRKLDAMSGVCGQATEACNFRHAALRIDSVAAAFLGDSAAYSSPPDTYESLIGMGPDLTVLMAVRQSPAAALGWDPDGGKRPPIPIPTEHPSLHTVTTIKTLNVKDYVDRQARDEVATTDRVPWRGAETALRWTRHLPLVTEWWAGDKEKNVNGRLVVVENGLRICVHEKDDKSRFPPVCETILREKVVALNSGHADFLGVLTGSKVQIFRHEVLFVNQEEDDGSKKKHRRLDLVCEKKIPDSEEMTWEFPVHFQVVFGDDVAKTAIFSSDQGIFLLPLEILDKT